MNFSFNQIKTCVEVVQAKIREYGVRGVNWGGCGVFASLLADKMTSLGIPEDEIKIINYSYDGNKYDLCEIEDTLCYRDKYMWSNWDDIAPGIGISHTRVCWNDHIFDAEDGVDLLANNMKWSSSAELCKGHFSHEAMRQLASNPFNWNTCFDRDQIPILQEIIDNAFSCLEQNKNVL